MMPAVGQWWVAKRKDPGTARRALHIIEDSGERTFRWICREHWITPDGTPRNGVRVGISATGLKRSYLPPQEPRATELLFRQHEEEWHGPRGGSLEFKDGLFT